jgi:imidazoleglycerol-phosphate dehydratase
MDEALSEVCVDVCGRATCVYHADFPQKYILHFDLAMVREFLIALAANAKMSLHAACRYGENSHHMVESLFKALGRTLALAYRHVEGDARSTKGIV